MTDRHPLLRVERRAATHVARASCLTLLASLLVTATAAAQASRTDRPYNVTFETSGQSMWGPGTTPLSGADATFTFADVSWDKSGTVGNVVDVAGFDFGADISAASRGAFGIFAKFSDIGTGAVAVNYPVRVTMGIPDPNTFHEGQSITIPTSIVLLPGATIATDPPRGSFDLRAKALLAASAGARLCVFDCLNVPLFPSVDIGSDNIPLFSLTVNPEGEDQGSIAGLNFTLPHTLTFIEQQITSLEGTIGLPKVVPVNTLHTDGFTLTAGGSNTFIDLSLDLDGFFTGKIPLGFQSPNIHGVQIGYETIGFAGVLKMTQSQEFSFKPTIFVRLAFPRDVAWSEIDGDGATVASGTGNVITFHAGNTLQITYPDGLKDPMTIEPFFAISNSFSSSTTTTAREDLVLTIGQFNLHVPAFEVIPEITVDVCRGLTVDADLLDVIPDEFCPVTTPALRSPAIDVDLGPLFQKSLVGASQQLLEFPGDGDGSWELQGFTTLAGGTFVLDPENPIIHVATTVASGLASGTGPAGTLTQDIIVSNRGDVPLSATQIADALSAAVAGGGGFSVRSVTTTMHADPAFNGIDNPNILVGDDVLPVGGSGTVAVSIGVEPGNMFSSALNTDGTSPIGTNVQATAGASFGVYAFNIIPQKLNDPSTGVLPVVVFGTPGMDVTLIDPASVELIGVSPLRWDLETRSDGVVDLTLKFDRDAIRASLIELLAAAPASPGGRNLDARAVALNLLGEGELDAVQLALADRNSNGRLDIGDIRALLGKSGGPDPGIFGAPKPAPVSRYLVLTGMLHDGTPFMGEDSLITEGGAP